MLRLHDVAEARDFLLVGAALDGSLAVPPQLRLPEELRREAAAGTKPATKRWSYEEEVA